VNISALHIVREDLVADISQLMACDGLPAQHLIIELTESHRLTDIDKVANTFRRLGAAGVRLAVDDFGTGYSSLGQLLALPVSIVKVDHSLTTGCDIDDDRAGVVRAIRQLAASLGHVVVAEGIETIRECEVMAGIGIDQAQGYLFCPPLPLPELEDELARHRGNWPSFGHIPRITAS
jgi:EAL domain-containing protein (putative c-di-GMP-specific phosphodiesterase class I)